MTKFKVVLVPFPFDDLTSSKVRPAVCLTDPVGLFHHVVLAFISSRMPPDPLPSDLVLAKEHPDFHETGLHVTSVLRLHRLMTAGSRLIRRELGRLSPRLQRDVERCLLELFDLDEPSSPMPRQRK